MVLENKMQLEVEKYIFNVAIDNYIASLLEVSKNTFWACLTLMSVNLSCF